MLTELLGWGSKYPRLRRPFMQLYRRAWRVRQATLAKAVLVIQNDTGGVFVSDVGQDASDPFPNSWLAAPTSQRFFWDQMPRGL